ncbi:putative KAP-like P-loop ATPase [Maribacter caenipelagi]|uniref:Putative KAP-like P-loop ATPase n=1 Tax=Maribacter caenipelagi TaxID=1447781 RepID=A0A4R7D1M4_9FLAO|nr:P-loop NTPase fold protein [Maribacter caenipelagi]TDS14237.1 putative KAP-like P-loop ATPase [Maribacter caenipelagi]
MWNDNETNQDLIDYKYLTDSINLIINNDNLVPSTIGVYGDWGSGKSSLMKMIEIENTKEDNLIIKFNGWLFEGYEDAKIALLSTLVDELIKSRTWDNKALKYIGRLVKKVKWLKVLTKTGQIGFNTYMASNTDFDYANALKEISDLNIEDYVKEIQDENQDIIEKGIREFHNDFETLIKETNINRVIVLIDDLDRCNPDTIISTLEAIKLFLFVDKSIFIISADERLINYAVKKKFPELPSTDYDVSKDYIEKLIHFPIRIPSMSEPEFETYTNFLFSKLHLKSTEFEELIYKAFNNSSDDIITSKLNSENISDYLSIVPEGLKQDLILSKQINSILVSILSGNPRQCKRFLNMLMIRLNMAKSKGIDLKKNVLAKLMLLEYFKTESFNQLVKASYEKDKNVLKSVENIDEAKENIDSSFDVWMSDTWLKKWVITEPKLGEIDLKNYFYFTRGNLNFELLSNKRISLEAREILENLLKGGALQTKALKGSLNLSSTDITSIFSEISNRISIEEVIKERGKLNILLLKFCQKHPILISEYCAFMDNASESIIMPANVPNLLLLTDGTPFEPTAKKIIFKWSNSNISMLSKIAKSKL